MRDMPVNSFLKKNKVCLTDYPYLRDIENRLLMAQFTVLDVQIVEEILDGSLSISIEEIASTLEVSKNTLLPTLEKLSQSGLLQVKNGIIFIDKEMRKYFEAQMVKFDPKFNAGVEYIKSFLKKVPIDILPTWYALPRTSDDIFESIIEKYLVTPKVFQRHLEELSIEIPIFSALWNDLIAAPNFTLPAKELYTKHHLSKEHFEELMLQLEFNFACCISYVREEGQWVEVVSPFVEWKKYLHFLKETRIIGCLDNQNISKSRAAAFVDELSLLLKQIRVKPLNINTIEKNMADRLLQLRLVEPKGSHLHPLDVVDHFLTMSPDQKSHLLHRTSILKSDDNTSHFYIEKHLREIEKILSSLTKSGWIFFDDFIKSCTACIGSNQEITLKKVGKNWEYLLPKYTQEEIAFIKELIFERLAEAGTVETGLLNNRSCFKVTPFGHKILSRD